MWEWRSISAADSGRFAELSWACLVRRGTRERPLFIEPPDGQLHAYQTPADAGSSCLVLLQSEFICRNRVQIFYRRTINYANSKLPRFSLGYETL
jgi:hypothetical protein